MSNNWPIPMDAEDVFRAQHRRITRQERRPPALSIENMIGPGYTAQAVQIVDWNSFDLTFNGFYYSVPGALNSPNTSLSWTGQVIAKDDGTGMQQVWNTDGPTMATWVRTYTSVEAPPVDPVTLIEFNVAPTVVGSAGFTGAIDRLSDSDDATYVWSQTVHDPDGTDSTGTVTLPIGYGVMDNPMLSLRAQVTAPDAEYPPEFDVEILDDANVVIHSERITLTALATIEDTVVDLTEVPGLGDGTKKLRLGAGEVLSEVAGNFRMEVYEAWIDGEPVGPQDTGDVLTFGEWKKFATPSGYIGDTELDPPLYEDIQDAIQNAADALEFAESSNRVFRQAAAPVSDVNYTLRVNDVWFDTDDDNRMRVWDGDSWEDAEGVIVSGILGPDPIQTSPNPNEGIKIDDGGIVAYDTGGLVSFILDAATGTFTTTGSAFIAGDIDGGVITGALFQTDAAANTGIKINTAGFAAYDSLGDPTFVIDAATGAVTMIGGLLSGGTIEAAMFRTAPSGNRVQIDSSDWDSIKFYSPSHPEVDDNLPGRLQEFNFLLTDDKTLRVALFPGNFTGGSPPMLSLDSTRQTSTGVMSAYASLLAEFVNLGGWGTSEIRLNGITRLGSISNTPIKQLNCGFRNSTVNASGIDNVPHGLGVVPDLVFAIPDGTGNTGRTCHWVSSSSGSTTFALEWRRADGTLVPGGNSSNCSWIAIQLG